MGEGSKCVVEEELLILWLIEIVEQLKKLGLAWSCFGGRLGRLRRNEPAIALLPSRVVQGVCVGT